MKGMLPLWVGHLEESDPEVRQQVLAVSAATIDRLLAPVKMGGVRKKPLVPRSDAAMKALVAIRAERWATREVGWTEVDTVAPLWRRHGRQLHLVVDQRGDPEWLDGGALRVESGTTGDLRRTSER